jgi:urate oxidase
MQHNAYGKSRVRLTKIIRHPDRHDVKEFAVDIQLEGDFDDSYLKGDNSKVVATDSMKNTVYALAADHPLTDIEGFARFLGQHFLKKYAQVREAMVFITEDLWQRVVMDGKEHHHAFVSCGGEKRTTAVGSTRDSVEIDSGLEQLVVLKTTDSEFHGFVRDEYTTLADTKDRIFATSVSANWTFASDKVDYNRVYAKIRQTIIDVFATHHSLAVQQTEHVMAAEILKQCPEVKTITISMPNQHRIPVDLTKFGLQNRNEIFVPIDEPYGLISITMGRE